MSRLAIWSSSRSEWVSYPDDEIIWLDRILLSDGRDQSLHRVPRCPGLRYVHHRWELFSRDSTHTVYVAPFTPGEPLDSQAIAAAAKHVLRPAQLGLETQPARLDGGCWVIGVGRWMLPVCIDVAPQQRDNPTIPHVSNLPATYDFECLDESAGLQTPPAPDAVTRVRKYFQRNPTACLAMAYYFGDFIRGAVAPQVVPMLDVVIALDLTNEGTVSEYKKELQRRIWHQQGHQRELGKFLLTNGLIGSSDLARALKVAADNEESGRSEHARKRLRYKAKRAI